MLENNVMVKITNRNKGYVTYKIPELNNLRRTFLPGETKEISMDELRKLYWTSGGAALIEDCLIVQNQDAIQELFPQAEPEYFYGEAEVKHLLQFGSLDELKDAIDFAPQGVVDLIKHIAVEIKVNDVAKREAIRDMTGFDVTKAIEINAITEEESKVEVKARRVGANKEEVVEEVSAVTPQRRAATPSFSIKKN